VTRYGVLFWLVLVLWEVGCCSVLENQLRLTEALVLPGNTPDAVDAARDKVRRVALVCVSMLGGGLLL
jgi:hypothetical protein